MRSFGFALAGLATLLREQHNARLHLLATVAVVVLALALDVSRNHWLVLLLTMAVVWLAEALNSALEYVCDAAVPEQHELIGKAKDVAAAGGYAERFVPFELWRAARSFGSLCVVG